MIQAIVSSLGTTAIILTLIYLNPEKFEKWMAILTEKLSDWGLTPEKHATKRNIQAGLNSYIARMSNEVDIDSRKVKLNWTAKADKEETRTSRDGEVVLVLRDRGRRQQNFAHAAYLFTSTVLLRNVKTHISKKQSQALDLFTTSQIIESESVEALGYFNADIANPLLKDEKIRDMVEDFDDINSAGFYLNILLQELEHLGTKVVFSKRKSDVHEEVRHLISFLHNFALREVGDDSTPDEFNGRFLKTSIKIVSTKIVRYLGRPQGPAKRINDAFAKGIENVYVLGPLNNQGKQFIEQVCGLVLNENDNLKIKRKKAFKGVLSVRGESSRTDSYMIQLRIKQRLEFGSAGELHKSIDKFIRGRDE